MKRAVWGIDHIYIPLREAEAAFRCLVDELDLPIAWPYASYGVFASGGINFGNVNLEVLLHSEADPSFHASHPAKVRGIAFRPIPTPELLAELELRKLAHTPPGVFPPGATVGAGARWTNTALLSVSDAMTNVFACEYHIPGVYDYDARKGVLDACAGGKLGLEGVAEVVLGSSGVAGAIDRWQQLLDPIPQIAPGCWSFDHGPALRVVETAQDEVVELVLTVRSAHDAKRASADLFQAMNGLSFRLVDAASAR